MIEPLNNIKVSDVHRMHDIELVDKINELVEAYNKLEDFLNQDLPEGRARNF